MNLYELLDVSPTANQREIKKSYRWLLSSDGVSGELFAVIEDAYATLSDDQLRQAYDEQLVSEDTAPQLAVPAAESPKLVDKPTPVETAFPETGLQSSPPHPSRKRPGRRLDANPARTFISCVAAALAAGPIALFILKLVFEKDPLNLWEEPPVPITERRPVDPGNIRVPVTSPTTPDINNSNDVQRSGNPPITEPEGASKPVTPLLQPEKSPRANMPIPQTTTTAEPDNSNPTHPRGTANRTRDQRLPAPTNNELAGPLSRLKKLFDDDYKAAKTNTDPTAQNVALLELGKNLFANGKLVQTQDANGAFVKQNRIEKYAWYQVALNIIVQTGDIELVDKICEAISSEYQIEHYELTNEITDLQIDNILAFSKGKTRTSQFLSAWKLLFQETLKNSRISIDANNKTAAVKQLELTRRILPQLLPKLYLDPKDQAQLHDLLIGMFEECLSTSEQHSENLHFELAYNVLQIAKSIATIGPGEDEKSRADRRLAQNAPLLQLQIEYEDALMKYAKSPDDPNINSAIAKYTILILKRWDDGLFFLSRGRDATLAKIAKTDNLSTAAARERNAPLNLSDEIKLAEQWFQLYDPNDLDINRKEIIFGRTIFWYEQTIPDLTPLQKLELDKLLDDLNNGFK